MASSSTPAPLTDAKRRIIERLQRLDAATPPHLAEGLGLTASAVRQHLDALAAMGFVAAAPVADGAAAGQGRGRGRPAAAWSLTPLARELFPDRHADLTVELLASVQRALGEDGLDAVIEERTRAQEAAYRAALSSAGPSVRDRAAALAAVRTTEGYAAEVLAHPDGEPEGVLLVEHHCPICAAATACTQLCRSELELFSSVLGDDVAVTRTQHLLSGDRRCAYAITPVQVGRRGPSRRRRSTAVAG